MSINDYPNDGNVADQSYGKGALTYGSFPNQPLIFPQGTFTLSTIEVNAEGRIIAITQGTAVAQKGQRVTTGSVGASSTVAVTLTWTAPFADANYTPVAAVLDSTGNLTVVDISAYTASLVTVNVHNNDSVNPHTGTLLVMAIHD